MLHLLGGIEEVVLTRRLPACDGSQGFKVMSSQLLAKHHTVSWLAFVAKTTSWPLKIENRSSGDHVGFFLVAQVNHEQYCIPILDNRAAAPAVL